MDKRKAKLDSLRDLSKEMKKMMGEGYADSMQKVTVAADSKEGLQKGLSKAQEIMKKKGLMEEMDEESMDEPMSEEEKEMYEDIDDNEEEELSEDMEEMADKVDVMSPEEIKKKIEELQAKLAEME